MSRSRASQNQVLVALFIGLVIGIAIGVYISKPQTQAPQQTFSRETIRETVTITSPGSQETLNYTILIDEDYYKELSQWIPRANKSMYVIMYVVKYDPKDPNDPVNKLLYTLSNLSKRGVDVKVVVDDETYRSYPETIDFMLRNNISVKLDESSARTTHTKLVIIDGEVVFFGSHNWTQSALEKNHELSIMIINRDVANTLTKYFNKIWSNGRSVV